jgi:hypothetical protein
MATCFSIPGPRSDLLFGAWRDQGTCALRSAYLPILPFEHLFGPADQPIHCKAHLLHQ